MAEYINITPTWEEILPTWLGLARGAYADIDRGRARYMDSLDGAHKVADNFETEMLSMARAADKWNAHCKGEVK